MRLGLILSFIFAFRFIDGEKEKEPVDKNGEVSSSVEDKDSQDLRPTIYKCQCGANQALNGDKCVDEVTSVVVYNPVLQDHIRMSTTTFGVVIVKPLSCGPDMIVTTTDRFFFLEAGRIYDYGSKTALNTDKFCFGHQIVNNTTLLYARRCVGKPTVTQCCPKGFILNSTFECSYEKNFDFTPTFSNGISWKNPKGNVTKFKKCDDGFNLESVNVSDYDSFTFSLFASDTNEATLSLGQKDFDIELKHNSSQFCIAARKTNPSYFYEAFFCSEDAKLRHEKICSNASCVHKCCPLGTAYNNDYKVCYPPPRETPFPFDDAIPNSTYLVVTGNPFCDSYISVDSSYAPILKKGSLHVQGLSKRYLPGQYCVEHVINGDSIEPTAFLCPIHMTNNCSWRHTLASTLLVISSVFLFATLVVYIGIKDLRSRMAGRCLISEVLSLLVTYVTLVVIQTHTIDMSSTGCQVIGVILHVSILASFFWLNVMCFDVWSTIRSHRPMDDESRTNRRFIFYSIYGWGFPLLIGVVAILVENLLKERNNVLRPGFGEGHCFFSGPRSQWAYLYSVVVVLLLSNIGFFAHLVFILEKARRENQRIFSAEGRAAGGGTNRPHQERLCMYVKLFVVMGLSWVAEVVSYQVETSADLDSHSCFYWLLTDIANALRGVLVFAIFVCKKTTLRKIASTWRTPSVEKRRSLAPTQTRSSHTPSANYASIDKKVSFHDEQNSPNNSLLPNLQP